MVKGGRNLTHIAYTWLIIILGLWGLVRQFSSLDLDYCRFFVLFMAMGVVTEWLAVNFPRGQLSGGFAVVMAVFLTCGTPAAAWVGALATLCAQGIVNRGNPLRTILFNATQHVLAVTAAGYVFSAAGGRTGIGVSLELALPLLAFVLVYFGANFLLVALYQQQMPGYRRITLSWWDVFRWGALTYLFTAPLGVLMALLYSQMGYGGVLLFFFPVLVVQLVLRMYVHLELANRELIALYQVARKLGEGLDPEQIAELILREAGRVVHYHSGVVYLLAEEPGCYRAKAATGPFQDDLLRTMVRSGEGFAGRILREGQPELIYDSREDPRVSGEGGLSRVYRSLMFIPLVADAGVIGLLLLGEKRRMAFDENHLDTLTVIAVQAAVAMANALLVHRLEESANTDGLTGIYNHRYFLRRMSEEYRRTSTSGLPLALIMLDVDDFKRINDSFGHPAGDAVLVELAALLREGVGEAGVVCRYGGEEFAVLLPGTDAPAAGSLAENLRQMVREHPFPLNRLSVQVRISLGVAACPGDARDVDDLVQRADQALYRAKKRGKDCVVLYREQ
ncbi:diguanylate cyclase [Desulfofundulus thermobenzoicus]|uniref:Diguanylate cyclase n=1 Tax=Desulfofundulus thermobenzoicus TaxID=29376 RepID=A0A6N7IR74_9FIRM|nr:sensor domain-containing diguanylate cyclase [Desulfofundulus thermobenzoicus]MQL52564.1 diguanylate cyclase [Desulfofundulus thermobenzoicus]